MALNETQKERREGFAYALAIDLFPRLRKSDPAAFDRDVQALYEYMLQPPKHGGDPLHHLNLSKPDPNRFTNAEQWLMGPRDHPTAVFQQLSAGHAAQAAQTLGFDYQAHQLPVPLKGGYLQGGKMPGTWDTIKGTIKDIPKGTEKAAKAGGDAVGTGLGDIGGFLSGHIMWIVLAVVLVLIIKK